MAEVNRFSDAVAAKQGHYVYRLIDPRNGMTFYVGRGQGNRVFSHATGQQPRTEAEDDIVLKSKTIRDIKYAGLEVQHVIHRHGMNEESAKEVEAALIDAYPGLANAQVGYDSDRGVMHAEEVIRAYEAPEAVFRHKLILVWVNQSGENRDLIDAARYAWRISPQKANKADYVLAVRRGLIIGAFEVEGEWLRATPENFPSYPLVKTGKYGFRGHEAPDKIRELYLQKRVPLSYRSFGSFRYVNCR